MRYIAVLVLLFSTVSVAAGDLRTSGQQHLPLAQVCTDSAANADRARQWLADLFHNNSEFNGFYLPNNALAKLSPTAAFFGPLNVTGWMAIDGACPSYDFSAALRNVARRECNGEAHIEQSNLDVSYWDSEGWVSKTAVITCQHAATDAKAIYIGTFGLASSRYGAGNGSHYAVFTSSRAAEQTFFSAIGGILHSIAAKGCEIPPGNNVRLCGI